MLGPQALKGPSNSSKRLYEACELGLESCASRPNAVGEKGALKVYGKGDKAIFDWSRV